MHPLKIVEPAVNDARLPTPDPFLTYHAGAIKQLCKKTRENIVAIGHHLTKCHDHLDHGAWLPWLEHQFGWSDQTARNFMHVYEMSKSKNFLNLDLSVSSLYLLAAPSTTEEARDEVFERASSSEALDHADVKKTIAAHKPARGKSAEPQVAGLPPRPMVPDSPDKSTEKVTTPEAEATIETIKEPNADEDGLVEDAEVIKKNILDTISQHMAVVRAYKKIIKAREVSSFDREMKEEISHAIGGLISEWESLQAKVDAEVSAEKPAPAAAALLRFLQMAHKVTPAQFAKTALPSGLHADDTTWAINFLTNATRALRR